MVLEAVLWYNYKIIFVFMPFPEDLKSGEKNIANAKNFEEGKKEEERKQVIDGAEREQWKLSAEIGLNLKSGSDSVPKATNFYIQDIESDPFKQSVIGMRLYSIMDDQSVDYSSLSTKQKKGILLLMGSRALGDYDFGRKDSYDENRITFGEFKDNFIGAWEADIFIAKAQKKNAEGKWVVTDETKGELFKNLSELIDVPVSEIEALWDESKNDFDFQTKLHEKYFKAGVCRDIAVFQAKIASEMGFKDTFSTTVSTSRGGHVVMGFREEDGNISFIDYGRLIATDTPNMKLALSVLERDGGSIALNHLQSKGSEEGDNIILVKSKASEVLEEIARGSSDVASEEMSKSMDQNGLEVPTNEFNFSIDNDRTNLELNLDTIAGSTIISATMYQLKEDAATSIESAYAVRAAQEVGGKHIRGGLGTAYAHIKLKPLEGTEKSKAELNKFFISLYGKMHADVKLSEHVRYRVAAMVDVILDVGLDKGKLSSYQLGFGSENRLYYLVTPSLDLYVGMKNVHSLVPENLKNTPVGFDEIGIANNLLAGNVGADVKLGQWSGYRVNFDVQGQIGTQYLGKATEYSGKTGVDVGHGERKVFMDAGGRYVDSKDFRINEEGRIEGNLGYLTPISGGTLVLRGYAFDSKSLGEFRDSRLDQWGVGFNVDYYFQ
jgi:hypothetical protein